jgi:hypothetical protein
MMITAGPSPQKGPVIDLPIGKYAFEAYLPNGDVATETVTIHEGDNAPVFLRATDSPHEWLSWQHLSGYSPAWTPPAVRAAIVGLELKRRSEIVGPARKMRSGTLAYTAAEPEPVDLEIVTSVKPDALPAALLKVWKGANLNTLKWKHLKVPPRPESAYPMVDVQLRVTSYLYDEGPWQYGDQYYSLLTRPPAGPPLLAVLPIPWNQADFSGKALVDVIVDGRDAEAKGPEWPLRVSVVVRDRVMASVLGYLSSGDLTTAGRVAETAVNFLYEKGSNPIAAAGGAYALVRLPVDLKKPPAWVSWLTNLRNRFLWLPDGAILDGWAHLNGIGRRPNTSEAAVAFIAAAERGIPFYSSGVRLLFEGLTRVEVTLKPRYRPKGFPEAFEFARRMALRVDVRQPFTVVRLD